MKIYPFINTSVKNPVQIGSLRIQKTIWENETPNNQAGISVKFNVTFIENGIQLLLVGIQVLLVISSAF